MLSHGAEILRVEMHPLPAVFRPLERRTVMLGAPAPAGQAAEIYAIAGELVLAARVLMDHAQAASARGDRRGALVDLGQALQLAHAAKRLRRLAGFWRG